MERTSNRVGAYQSCYHAVSMAKLIGSPTAIATVGTMPKFSDEYVGLVNTGDSKLSITLMHSPPGWEGIGRIAKFHEYKLGL